MKNSKQLLKILLGQKDTCNGYLEVQRKKTDALVIGDIKRLDAIGREEQSFIMKMESFDKKRNQLLLEAELNNVTISELIAKYVEEEFKDRYQEVFDRLSGIINELKKVNALNQRLLKQRLMVVNNYLADISDGESKRNTV